MEEKIKWSGLGSGGFNNNYIELFINTLRVDKL